MLKSHPSRPSVIALLGLGGLGLLLVWLVATKSLAAYFADTDPEWALLLNNRETAALTLLAERQLMAILSQNEASHDDKKDDGAEKQTSASIPSATAENSDIASSLSNVAAQGLDKAITDKASEPAPTSTADLAEATRLATRALSGNSMNARAMRLLGQAVELRGDKAATANYMKLAASLSQRESYAVYWLMVHAYETHDYVTALHCADVLLRTRSRGPELAAPVLARLAEDNAAESELKKLLSQNPPWRAAYWPSFLASISDARTPLNLMLAMKDTPPTEDEIARYLNFLIGKKFYDLAYYAWLQFLSKEELETIGFLYNGSFEREPSGQPFDWSMVQGEGTTVTRVERSDRGDQHALSIQFGHGRVSFPGVGQMTALAPGKYTLRGESQGLIRGPRGMVWRVSCASNGTKLGESQMIFGTGRIWRDFEFDFEVPPTDCRSQTVQVVLDARSASEQLVSGSVLFDELSIVPAPQNGKAVENNDLEGSTKASEPD